MNHARLAPRLVALLALLGCSSPSEEGAVPALSPALLASHAGGIVASVDGRGVPRFIWSRDRAPAPAGIPAEVMARRHLARFSAAYGVDGPAIDHLVADGASRTPHGERLVRLRQEIDGVEVYGTEVKVLMGPDLTLLALSGAPSPLGGLKPGERRFALSPGDAVARSLSHLYGLTVPAGLATTTAPPQGPAATAQIHLSPAAPVRLSQPARAKRVYYPKGDRLVPAYFVEFYSSHGKTSTSDAYRYLVAADDGRVLERTNLTSDAAFQYRVFARDSGDKRPFDGPIADFTPHPTGRPDGVFPDFVAPNLVTVESLKQRPGVVDPWLPATATETTGNNVDAYADRSDPDGFSPGDLRATTTGGPIFDRAYDVRQEPESSDAQTMAAVTNLFYMVNWLHDYWYDSGFDEAAGNAQLDNFGRGGSDGDPILAEGQDFAGLNNANMSVPADGLSPRMQMFLWSSPEVRSLVVDQDGASLETGRADFGPQTFDVSAGLVLATDGTEPFGDACEALAGDVTGKIVLADRGTCAFTEKVTVAQAAGAIGIIIANDQAGPPPTMGGDIDPSAIVIPALSITLDAGAQLRQRLAGGAVTAHLTRRPAGPKREGAIDNMIVAHEWGHYLHHRASSCDTYQCAALSEGFADFTALHLVLQDGDNLDGTFGMAIYAPELVGDSGYFGIRRFPYSVDPARNALTFKHIQDGVALPATPSNPNPASNAEVHNAGEVWASMLFEAYVSFQKHRGSRSFEEARRAFASDTVLALELAPPGASFTEYRDALLAAIDANHPDDFDVVAQAFARRGAGTCALSPPDESPTLSPLTESFEVRPVIGETTIEIDDSVASCDDDGFLDAKETGIVHVQVRNDGPTVMSGTRVTLATTSTGVSFPDGPTASLGDIPRFQAGTAAIKVALAETVVDPSTLAFTVTVTNPSACLTTSTHRIDRRIALDEVPESSATEDAEAQHPPWDTTGAGAAALWSRTEFDASHHAWRGADSGARSDVALVSPALVVSAATDFEITFKHAYSFEFSDGTFWDGGVIEVSEDDGATWRDLSELTETGYNAPALDDTAGNPLAGRAAFGGKNPFYPHTDLVTLNLGRALAGKTVRVRFRIGTDEATGASGWIIDDIAFRGIDNTPFTATVANRRTCHGPVAEAGPEQTVESGAKVTLTAAGSRDADGDPLTFGWTQTAGKPVALSSNAAVSPTFEAPAVAASEELTFQVVVSDGTSSASASVTVHVRPAPSPDGGMGAGGAGDGGGGGGCIVASGGGGGNWLPVLGVVLLLALRRRRRA